MSNEHAMRYIGPIARLKGQVATVMQADVQGWVEVRFDDEYVNKGQSWHPMPAAHFEPVYFA